MSNVFLKVKVNPQGSKTCLRRSKGDADNFLRILPRVANADLDFDEVVVIVAKE